MSRFHPGVISSFRLQHGIPEDAFVVISVGTICYWHKRMDYVIREVAAVPGAWLVIVGQDSADSAAIKNLGQELMAGRIVFTTLEHDELPQAYAAANVFTLGSLFETFGIVYIEAMAMGLPVIATSHPNQRSIIREGVFIDMRRDGALTRALMGAPRQSWRAIGERGHHIAVQEFDLAKLRRRYVDRYAAIAATESKLPRHSIKTKLIANARNAWRATLGWLS
jgi:glycosyltransferase involved in cell wall biosynthesis